MDGKKVLKKVLKKELASILTTLALFPRVIELLIEEYAFSWEGTVLHQWTLPKTEKNPLPFGVVYFQDRLYVSDFVNNRLHSYTLDGKLLETWTSLSSTSISAPCGLDVSEDNLFFLNHSHLCVMNKKKQLLHKWPLPGTGNQLKIDHDRIYLTIHNHHQVYVYNRKGKLINVFGKYFQPSRGGGGGGEGGGEFKPYGVTVDDQFLYVGDRHNHRIQVLDKKTGAFVRQWGQKDEQTNGGLYYPNAILLHEDLLHISDCYRVQIFTKEGVFVQRLGTGTDRGSDQGEFQFPESLCVVNHRLYVANSGNGRLQVFV